MIWVVKFIFENFTGVNYTIRINMFYTMMYLLMELDDMSIFDTGTIVDNLTLKEIIIINRQL